MRKVFVTGGAGFIGSAFIKLVLDEIEDCVVTNFDALTYAGNLDNLTVWTHSAIALFAATSRIAMRSCARWTTATMRS